MLDKQLCAILGIDAFTQWIMKQLDHVEDQLYESELSSPRYIELKSKHQALKEVRDAYHLFTQNKLNKAPEKEAVDDTPTYQFEVIIFDRQDDPSRFYKLTHHFDYICPLDLYPDVTVSDVILDTCIYPDGYKVTVTGFISGQNVDRAMTALSLEGWGDASLVATHLNRIAKSK